MGTEIITTITNQDIAIHFYSNGDIKVIRTDPVMIKDDIVIKTTFDELLTALIRYDPNQL